MVSRLADLEKAVLVAKVQDRSAFASTAEFTRRVTLPAVCSVAPFLIRKSAIAPSRKDHATKTKTLKKLLLLCGSLVFVLVSAEGALRLFPLFRPLARTYVGDYQNRKRAILIADPALGWKMKPKVQLGIYRSNAQGFRAPFDFSRDQPCQRIALVGDSFTFGANVKYEQTFAALIGASLPKTCVDNMGMPGYGMDQIWQTFETQGLPLQPSLVIVAFISAEFTRSEEAYRITEGFNKPTFKLASSGLVPKIFEDRPSFPLRFLQAHSSLWRVFSLADRTVAHRYPHGEWWYLNTAILDAIRDDCRKAGVAVLFGYIPTREWGAFPSLRGYMLRNQANFVDLSQGEFALVPSMYFPGDGHLNDKGHRQVADAIQHWLQQTPPILE